MPAAHARSGVARMEHGAAEPARASPAGSREPASPCPCPMQHSHPPPSERRPGAVGMPAGESPAPRVPEAFGGTAFTPHLDLGGVSSCC